jgi:hypothetical protein
MKPRKHCARPPSDFGCGGSLCRIANEHKAQKPDERRTIGGCAEPGQPFRRGAWKDGGRQHYKETRKVARIEQRLSREQLIQQAPE